MGSSPARDQHWTWPKMVRQRTWGDKSGQSGQKKCESLLLNPSSLNRNAAQAQTKVQISPWSSSCAQKNVKSSPATAPTSQVVQMYVFTQESKAVSCRVYTTLALIDRASDLAPPPSAHSASSKHVCSHDWMYSQQQFGYSHPSAQSQLWPPQRSTFGQCDRAGWRCRRQW